MLFGICGTVVWKLWKWPGLIALFAIMTVWYFIAIGFRKYFNRKTAGLINDLPKNEQDEFMADMDKDQKLEIINYMNSGSR